MKKGIIIFKNERDVVTLCYRVIEKMENNTVFPDPPPALAALKKKAPDLQAYLVKAKGGEKEMVAIKNALKAEVYTLLEELATYVSNIAKGDRVLILSSGFDVSDEQSRSYKPTVEGLVVTLNGPGEATTRIKDQNGAIAYVHQYTTEPPNAKTEWFGEGSSTGVHTFKGLQSDKRYWFRVEVIGRRGQKAHSPIVSKSIQ